MFEVHTGSRPGRPTVLLLLAAGTLVGVLGFAWAQVQRTRALGGAVSLEDTPLIVRAPRGWVRESRNPNLFGKLIRKQVWGRERLTAERTVEFHYNDFCQQFTHMFQAAGVYRAQPARIGEWDGVQYVVERDTQRLAGQMVFRCVTTPAGGQIAVTYMPLAELTHGDLYLLDEICEAVQVDDSGSDAAASTQPARVGVSFPIAADWEILGPDAQGGEPGFWIQHVEGDRPVWAIGVFRRSLENARELQDLLRAESPLLRGGRLRESSRQDGTYVGALRRTDRRRDGSAIVSIWAVAQPPTRAVVLYVLADAEHAGQADEAAAGVAGTLQFASGPLD